MADETDLELNEIDDEADSAPDQAQQSSDQEQVDDETLEGPTGAQDLEAVYEIPVRVSAVLGTATMQVNQLLKLGRGAVVELDRKVGEAIDIYVNNRLVARGEVVVVDDKLGITMTEIIKTEQNT
ncbi:MAG: flagellar motor switch protein FliN [Rhodospirillaceae bacterium]|nr:flagellar motor switch protein FliN [Rhodospirillaceae bacterium]